MAYPVSGGRVTFSYGVRRSHYAAGYHTGDDYAKPTGSSVYATRAGRVVAAGRNVAGSSYGIAVLIQTGGVRHLYAHLSAEKVSVGEWVSEGEVIGLVGSTGFSSGPHLHYEERTSPYGYYQNRKPRFNRTKKKKRNVRSKTTVDLSYIRSQARKSNTDRSSQVLLVQRALKKAVGLNYSSGPGHFGPRTETAYAAWQRKCGYRGRDADGIPGLKSLRKLGKKYGFNVKP